MLLREHLQEQHREGSIVSEGNQCKLNRGCDRADCAGTGRGRGGTAEGGITACLAAAGQVIEGEGEGEGAPAAAGEEGSAGGGGGKAREGGAGTGQTCVPTAEEEGLPLPAAMTLRFLAAMDEGYVGSRREENARLKRRRTREERAG